MPSLPLATIDFHAASCLAAIVVFVAALTDIRSHKIYNALTYPAMGCGLLLAVLAGLLGQLQGISAVSVTECLAGLLGCGFLMLVPYHLSRGGAGDVKLAMAMGSLVGFQTTLQGFCVGYILAATYLILRSGVAFATQRIAARDLQLIDGRVVESIVRERSIMNEPIPLAGFFLLGMAGVAWLGPLW